jgi:hypothetical protein
MRKHMWLGPESTSLDQTPTLQSFWSLEQADPATSGHVRWTLSSRLQGELASILPY